MSPRIVLVDNNDSFTHLLRDRLHAAGAVNITILPERQADRLSARDVDALILSPGPGLPDEHPHSLRLLAEAVEHRTPCLGICLGFQMQALHFGARLMQLAAPRHGVETRLQLSPGALSGPAGIDMTIGLYHSWAVDPASWPEELKLLGSDAEGIPMALEHRSLPLRGFQFHPESVLSPRGGELLAAFLREVEGIRRSAEAARDRAQQKRMRT